MRAIAAACLVGALVAAVLAQNPCSDTTYLRLKAIPVDSLTAGAATVFLSRERACLEYRCDEEAETVREATRYKFEEKGKTAAAIILAGSFAIAGVLLIVFLNVKMDADY